MSVVIPVVLGTGRKDRESKNVAAYILEKVNSFEDVQGELVDVRDYLISPFTVPAWVEDENASKWRKIASEAPGFIFVVPEYNHSFPGEFKLLLDSAYKEYANKFALLVGVSAGQYGGVRVLQHLAPVFHELNIHLTKSVVATAHVEKQFKDTDSVDAKYEEFLGKGIQELLSNLK